MENLLQWASSKIHQFLWYILSETYPCLQLYIVEGPNEMNVSETVHEILRIHKPKIAVVGSPEVKTA